MLGGAWLFSATGCIRNAHAPTRFDMFISVVVSRRPSQTVAVRCKGITYQAILCNWPVADNRVAHVAWCGLGFKNKSADKT